ncbi:hypothetical protein OKZ62_001449 [Vibrio navarrensis]|nr:hypothetical protein [Vibrio navarrensis]
MSNKVFHNYCKNALEILRTQYDSTKILKHNAMSGAVREQIIKDFLSEHLPELISVVSGQIFDSKDSYSKQQDIVLVLKSMPRLPFSSGNELIFQEGVVATIEIKTTLNRAVLKNIGDNIKSVNALQSAIGASALMGVTHNWLSNRVLTTIITYGGSNLASYIDELANLGQDQKPDLLLDLSQGLLIKNHGLLLPQSDNVDYLLVNDAAEGFKLFLTFLTEITGTLASRGVCWRNYL